MPLDTTTLEFPGFATSPAETAVLTCVDVIKVVGCSVPFHNTVDCVVKPLPFKVKLKGGPPTARFDGLLEESVGVEAVDGSTLRVTPTENGDPCAFGAVILTMSL